MTVRHLPRLPSSTPVEATNVDTVFRLRMKANRGIVEQAPEGEIVEGPLQGFLSKVMSRGGRQTRPPRDDGYLHVSDLIHRCIRKSVLVRETQARIRIEPLSANDRFTFAQGDAIHDVAKAMAAEGSPESVWGKWRCKCGRLTHDEPCTFAEVDVDDKCEYCGAPPTEYVEVSLKDERNKIVGHPDLMFYLRNVDAYHPIELKSIAHDAWKEMVRPLPDHVIQVLFYWYLMKTNGYRVSDRATILYITKGWMFSGAPWKEFTVEAATQVARLKPYLDQARLFAAYPRSKILPARLVCKTQHSTTAAKCEVCKACFSTAT